MNNGFLIRDTSPFVLHRATNPQEPAQSGHYVMGSVVRWLDDDAVVKKVSGAGGALDARYLTCAVTRPIR